MQRWTDGVGSGVARCEGYPVSARCQPQHRNSCEASHRTLDEAMIGIIFWGNTALNPRSSAKQQYEGRGEKASEWFLSPGYVQQHARTAGWNSSPGSGIARNCRLRKMIKTQRGRAESRHGTQASIAVADQTGEAEGIADSILGLEVDRWLRRAGVWSSG